jgi:D-glycero-alpha-D-manno-heptose-7-phosphate kinase
VIVVRAPLRITLGGGGTDIPAHYSKYGGMCVSAAIDKYVYITVNHNFHDQLVLHYSDIERVSHYDQVNHRLLRAILTEERASGIELTAFADVPAGTGLGSSGSFTVAALHAIRAYYHKPCHPLMLADKACDIELNRLGDPIGKQDQYIASLGGIQALKFQRDGLVEHEPVQIDASARTELEENLLLFYTGLRHVSGETLSQMAPLDREVADLGEESIHCLMSNNLNDFAASLTQQWRLKYRANPSEIHREIDHAILNGIAAGARGGKLVGAGNGGFLLFYAADKTRLRAKMSLMGMKELSFRFDYNGSAVLVR